MSRFNGKPPRSMWPNHGPNETHRRYLLETSASSRAVTEFTAGTDILYLRTSGLHLTTCLSMYHYISCGHRVLQGTGRAPCGDGPRARSISERPAGRSRRRPRGSAGAWWRSPRDPLRRTNAVLRAAQLAGALDALERHLIAECGDECECAACRTRMTGAPGRLGVLSGLPSRTSAEHACCVGRPRVFPQQDCLWCWCVSCWASSLCARLVFKRDHSDPVAQLRRLIGGPERGCARPWTILDALRQFGRPHMLPGHQERRSLKTRERKGAHGGGVNSQCVHQSQERRRQLHREVQCHRICLRIYHRFCSSNSSSNRNHRRSHSC